MTHPSPFLITALAAAAFLPLATIAGESKPNALTAGEKAAGWQLLFDGRAPTSWRSFGTRTNLPIAFISFSINIFKKSKVLNKLKEVSGV